MPHGPHLVDVALDPAYLVTYEEVALLETICREVRIPTAQPVEIEVGVPRRIRLTAVSAFDRQPVHPLILSIGGPRRNCRTDSSNSRWNGFVDRSTTTLIVESLGYRQARVAVEPGDGPADLEVTLRPARVSTASFVGEHLSDLPMAPGEYRFWSTAGRGLTLKIGAGQRRLLRQSKIGVR